MKNLTKIGGKRHLNVVCIVIALVAAQALLTTCDNPFYTWIIEKNTPPPEPIWVKEVRLTDEDFTLVQGTSKKLAYQIIPEGATYKSISWASDDSSIVSVDKGIVTALSGTGYNAVITITVVSENESFQDFITITTIDEIKINSIVIKSVSGNTILSPTELVVGQRLALTTEILPATTNNKKLEWIPNSAVVTVTTSNDNRDALITANTITSIGLNSTNPTEGKGTATITVKDIISGEATGITVTTTMQGNEPINSAVALKSMYHPDKGYFLIGNICNDDTDFNNQDLQKHFAILTPVTGFLPENFSDNDVQAGVTLSAELIPWDNQGISKAQALYNNAKTNFQFNFHALITHENYPDWWDKSIAGATYQEADNDKMTYNPNAKMNVNNATELLKGWIQKFMNDAAFNNTKSWDVVDGAFQTEPTAATWRQALKQYKQDVKFDRGKGNPWQYTIGDDYIRIAFEEARRQLPNATLCYNDYDGALNPQKAKLIFEMVKELNNEWKKITNKPENLTNTLLIDVIGFTEHYYPAMSTGTGTNKVTGTALVKNLFDNFTASGLPATGVKLAISGLDVRATKDMTAPDYQVTNRQQLEQAQFYGECFKTFIQYSEYLDRVTFWGVKDNESPTAPEQKPLIFDSAANGASYAKPAYYMIINALEN